MLTDTGEEFDLADHQNEKIVLYFYPRADTPGCTIESCEFRDTAKKFTKKGVTVTRHLSRHDEGPGEVQGKVRSQFHRCWPTPIKKSPISTAS